MHVALTLAVCLAVISLPTDCDLPAAPLAAFKWTRWYVCEHKSLETQSGRIWLVKVWIIFLYHKHTLVVANGAWGNASIYWWFHFFFICFIISHVPTSTFHYPWKSEAGQRPQKVLKVMLFISSKTLSRKFVMTEAAAEYWMYKSFSNNVIGPHIRFGSHFWGETVTVSLNEGFLDYFVCSGCCLT